MNKKMYNAIKKSLLEIKEVNEMSDKLFIETDNLEKTFPIEVIASHFERRLLNVDYQELKEFWDFITNEDVNISNIDRFLSTINNEIYSQYPKLKVLDINKPFLNEFEIKYLIDWYKKANGDSLKIKSIKKGYTKTLKMQDK